MERRDPRNEILSLIFAKVQQTVNRLKFKNQKSQLTFAQQQILTAAARKTTNTEHNQPWSEYEAHYNSDYNDGHGDYYDSE